MKPHKLVQISHHEDACIHAQSNSEPLSSKPEPKRLTIQLTSSAVGQSLPSSSSSVEARFRMVRIYGFSSKPCSSTKRVADCSGIFETGHEAINFQTGSRTNGNCSSCQIGSQSARNFVRGPYCTTLLYHLHMHSDLVVQHRVQSSLTWWYMPSSPSIYKLLLATAFSWNPRKERKTCTCLATILTLWHL